MSGLAEETLALARANDDRCTAHLLRCDDPEVVGELIVAVHATGTPAAARAVAEALARPFRRGVWQGWKRVFKVLERRLLDDDAAPAAHDLDLFAAQLFTMDQAPAYGAPVQPRTREYMKRRCYRAVKALAHRRGARFRALLERLAPRYGRLSEGTLSTLFDRVLRWTGVEPWAARPTRFVAPVDNPFLTAPPAEADLLALSAEDLVRAAPAPVAAATPPLAAAPPPWKGPIFVERWLEDPAWLVGLLETTAYEPLAGAIARVCEERAGERLLSVDLERFYGLLQHPMGAVWRLALSQVAARAHRDRLRWGELARLLDRTARAGAPDWPVIADLLAVLDDERADAEWAGLLPCLHDLVQRHPDAPGVGPVIDFLRRRLLDRLRPPLFGWSTALSLAQARRPDVRALARDLVATCADLAVLDAALLEQLVSQTSLPDEDPELVHRVLVRPRALPGGYRPSLMEKTTSAGPTATPWPLSRCALALDRAPEPGFQALRRALLAFEEDGGLEPLVAQVLIARDERRTRALGLELLGGALARGALPVTALPRLLASPREDVVVWARERLEADAAAGRLPNEALYRVLDLGATDAQAFGRDLVRRHLERFVVAELVVFCAESPDATTSELGISLYEERLKGAGADLRRGDRFDLRALVPMFRILLYRPATARAEKERLYATLRRWALEAVENARLVVDVVSELRRTESKVDRSRVVQLLALVRERFPDVEVPFTTTAVFSGHAAPAPEATWTSR